jgi:hypothetical protein
MPTYINNRRWPDRRLDACGLSRRSPRDWPRARASAARQQRRRAARVRRAFNGVGDLEAFGAQERTDLGAATHGKVLAQPLQRLPQGGRPRLRPDGMRPSVSRRGVLPPSIERRTGNADRSRRLPGVQAVGARSQPSRRRPAIFDNPTGQAKKLHGGSSEVACFATLSFGDPLPRLTSV